MRSQSPEVSTCSIRKTRLARYLMRGFSRLELMAVISIIAVVGAMALPTMLPTLRYRKLQNTLLSSAGAIQSARYQALSTGVPYQITFNHTTGTYQFFACSNCAGTIYNPTSTFTYAAVGAGTVGIPSGPIPFSVSGGATLAADQTIYFRPGGAVQWVADGTTSCSAPLSMTFSYQGVSKALTVECYGKVTVPQ